MAEKEYIEREPAIQAIRNIRKMYSKAKNFVAVSVVDNILGEIADEVPAADVAPVVHGHWDKPTKPFPYWDWKCSVCGCEEYRQMDSQGHYRIMKYCPNCGAKMQI